MGQGSPRPSARAAVGRWSLAGLGVLAVALFLGHNCSGPGRPPDVVVVLIDTLRADHTSLYGYPRETTPVLDRIAAEGLVLRRHLANAPWTKPSVASIFTGVHPSAHGSRRGRFEEIGRGGTVEVLSRKWVTLAEALAGAGYHTAAYLSNYQLTPKWGYDQGFADYRLVTGVPWLEADREAVDAAVATLAARPEPVFFWVHLMAVHQYLSPPGERPFAADGDTPLERGARGAYRVHAYLSLEAAVAAYDNAVHFDDAELGRLFAALRQRRRPTLLVVTSDHGEEFGDHGGYEHGRTLYPEMLRVPCVFWGTGVPRGEIDGVTDSLDLLPTILAAAGVEVPPPDRPGRVLFRDGRPLPAKGESFAEQHNLGPWRRFALTREEGLGVLSIDKETGAEQVETLAMGWGGEPWNRSAGELRRRLDAYLTAARKLHRRVVGASEEVPLDAEDEAPLRSLGYLR